MTKTLHKYKGILLPITKTAKTNLSLILKKPIFWIFVIGLIARIYRLELFPVGLHVDEAKVGWNALSILKTGLDDHNNFLSLYYDSFGDFRPTGIFYLTIPSLMLFGNTVFAIRFASAFIGALTILPIYILTNYVFSRSKPNDRYKSAGTIAALFLALSPWHIEVSRATSEPTISMFFALFALYFFIKYGKTNKPVNLLLSLFLITTSYLMYHSVRLLAPIFYLLTSVILFRKTTSKKIFIMATTILTLFVISFILSANKSSISRLEQVSIFKDVDTTYEIERVRSESTSRNLMSKLIHSDGWIYAKNLVVNYSSYFSGSFLLGPSARPYRYSTPGAGIVTHAELILIILGVFFAPKNKRTLWLIALLAVSPLPAAVTSEDTPNLHRALFMIPFLSIAASIGAVKVIETFKKNMNILYLLLPALLLFNYLNFFYMYFYHSQNHKPFIKNFFVDSPTYRNVGTIEFAKKIDAFSEKYDKVIITNFPDTPFVWYAFFTSKDPRIINQTYSNKTNTRVYKNIVFSEDKCPSDYAFSEYKERNILVVNAWECPHLNQINAGLEAKVIDRVLRPDGSEVFVLLERNELPKPTRVSR